MSVFYETRNSSTVNVGGMQPAPHISLHVCICWGGGVPGYSSCILGGGKYSMATGFVLLGGGGYLGTVLGVHQSPQVGPGIGPRGIWGVPPGCRFCIGGTPGRDWEYPLPLRLNRGLDQRYSPPWTQTPVKILPSRVLHSEFVLIIAL